MADEKRASLDTVCGAIAYAMGVTPPQYAAEKNFVPADYIDKVFGGEPADRVVMYNPDAIAQWIYQKYPTYLENVKRWQNCASMIMFFRCCPI